MLNTFYVFCVLIPVLFTSGAFPDEESCHSYAGGSVYPLGSDPEKTNHKLQYTKAVSKLH